MPATTPASARALTASAAGAPSAAARMILCVSRVFGFVSFVSFVGFAVFRRGDCGGERR
jgi:hypothetical protein